MNPIGTIPASAVADNVVDAIRRGRRYVFTDDQHTAVGPRLQVILDDVPTYRLLTSAPTSTPGPGYDVGVRAADEPARSAPVGSPSRVTTSPATSVAR